MEIIQAKTDSDFLKIENFFGTIWEEEFNLDIFDGIDSYKKQIVYFIETEGVISSAITCKLMDYDSYIGRFATNTNNRGKGYGTILLNEMIENLKTKGIKKVFLSGEINKMSFYEKFGFIKIGKPQNIGNTQSVIMRKELIV